MADTVKKAATPRKPRATNPKPEAAAAAEVKPATPKKAAPKPAATAPDAAATTKVTPIRAEKNGKVTHEQIAALAHSFWLERGGDHGHDAEDWIRAEQTLLGKAS